MVNYLLLLDFLFQHMIRYFSLLGSGYHVLGSRNDMPVTVIPFPSLGERKIILGNGILVTVNLIFKKELTNF